ncbi:tRNA (adenine(58)-N(1))-methyltransferase catalytic subunit TRMT61A-like [Saccostrea cucullata]|uniref:tRNA (adenine(58)-N(1))-methyltransferase catalytic subunit TRMT61A-like n=1 Tax=Saccostrea cuccullata TaxID=36930 RepID=UPI002ED1EB85
MSFHKYHEKVQEGDTVILYLGYENMHAIQIKRGAVFQTKYGALKHNDIIGTIYGSRVHCPKGYLYVLYPTPELWTSNLPHRTQILYSTDISVVSLQLDLKPGAVVVESGTGSASLSHAIIRSILPDGHLYTFEFHKERAQKAEEEFKDHGLSEYVTVTHKDVCQFGFDLEDVADAVFLDLPVPWDALPSAKKALKKQGGRICSFSPCIEQVQKTCACLDELGFEEISTMECLVRNYDVRTINLPNPEFSKEKSKSQPTDTRKMEQEDMDTDSPKGDDSVKCEESADTNSKACDVKDKNQSGDVLDVPSWDYIGRKSDANFTFKSGISLGRMPGHTGYLTFATLYPL